MRRTELQIIQNASDRDLTIYIEANPDRYKLHPGDMMHLAYQNQTDRYGLHTISNGDSLQIYLEDFDTATVTINGSIAEPWSE